MSSAALRMLGLPVGTPRPPAPAHPHEIGGHPVEPLLDDAGNLIQMITVCAHCGNARSILFLRKDRWYCTICRVEGAAPPNLYPVA